MRAKRNRMPWLVAPQDFHEFGRHLFNRARICGRGHAPIKPMGASFVTCGVESYIRRIGGLVFDSPFLADGRQPPIAVFGRQDEERSRANKTGSETVIIPE